MLSPGSTIRLSATFSRCPVLPSLLTFGLLAILPAIGRAQSIQFNEVVDSSTIVPGQKGGFGGGVGSFSPAASENLDVFYASGGTPGIYTGAAGAGAGRVVDTTVIVPGKSVPFSSFDFNPTISDGNVVAFLGRYNSNNSSGIFSGPAGGALSLVADSTTAAPGQSGNFSSVNPPSISGNNIAFDAYFNGGNGSGIYVISAGGSPARVADSTTVAPGQGGVFAYFSTPVISGANVAFRGTYNGGANSGIYVGTAGGVLNLVADSTTVVPGQSGAFTDVSSPAISGGNVAFVGRYSGGVGVYVGTAGGVLSRVADTSMTAPGQSGAFTGFSVCSISGTDVVFQATFTNMGSGLYLESGGNLRSIVATGDALFGNAVTSLASGAHGLNGSTLSFEFRTTAQSGVASAYIYYPRAPVVTVTPNGLGGFNFAFPTQTAVTYQLQRSSDLGGWTNVGAPVTGDGSAKTTSDTSSATSMFWRVNATPN